jgi:anaerobic ribonucleoside-triphosphate reductase
MVKVLKKNGSEQPFSSEKIKNAIRKSAERVCVTLSEKEEKKIVDLVKKQLQYNETAVPVSTIHNMVEVALDNVNSNVAKSYREYRDSKSQFSAMLDKVYSKKLSLNFIGDRSNANSDSALVTTQKAIVYNELNSELYKKFFLTHGHLWNEYKIPPIGIAGVLAHGHTHIPELKTLECGLQIFNPGSVSLPKGGSGRSIGYYDGDELKHFTI